jgi:hypothetical protein
MKMSRSPTGVRALDAFVAQRDHASPRPLVAERLLTEEEKFLRTGSATTRDLAWCDLEQAAFPSPCATPLTACCERAGVAAARW